MPLMRCLSEPLAATKMQCSCLPRVRIYGGDIEISPCFRAATARSLRANFHIWLYIPRLVALMKDVAMYSSRALSIRNSYHADDFPNFAPMFTRRVIMAVPKAVIRVRYAH